MCRAVDASANVRTNHSDETDWAADGDDRGDHDGDCNEKQILSTHSVHAPAFGEVAPELKQVNLPCVH